MFVFAEYVDMGQIHTFFCSLQNVTHDTKPKTNHPEIIKQIKSLAWRKTRETQRCCCGSKKRLFPRFYSTFQELYSGKDLEGLPVVSIDAHKISTVTVSDHVKPYAAVALKLSKKVMRECGHLKFMLGDIMKDSF